MSRDIEVLTILHRIRETAQAADSLCEANAAVTWTDAAALAQVIALAASGIGLMSQRDLAAPATVMASEAPQSSVEIETMAKGTPKFKVKVYSTSPHAAMAEARFLYDQAVRDYDPSVQPKVTEKEAVNGHA